MAGKAWREVLSRCNHGAKMLWTVSTVRTREVEGVHTTKKHQDDLGGNTPKTRNDRDCGVESVQNLQGDKTTIVKNCAGEAFSVPFPSWKYRLRVRDQLLSYLLRLSEIDRWILTMSIHHKPIQWSFPSNREENGFGWSLRRVPSQASLQHFGLNPSNPSKNITSSYSPNSRTRQPPSAAPSPLTLTYTLSHLNNQSDVNTILVFSHSQPTEVQYRYSSLNFSSYFQYPYKTVTA